MPDESPARRAAEEISDLIVKYEGFDSEYMRRMEYQYQIAAIIERHCGKAEKERIAELESIALTFFRSAVASNRNYPGDLNLLVDIARKANLCADTVEIHVHGTDVQIVGLKKKENE